MNTIKAIIIDDEPWAQKIILQYAEDIPFLEIVGQCYLATEAYALLNTLEVDLIFLDIQMPKLTGLEFLRTLERKPQVIISSAFQEYALESYELQVCDYLLKPFSFDRFLKAVNKVQKQLSFLKKVEKPIVAQQVAPSDKQLFIKVDKRYIHLNTGDIQYLESYGNYVKVWIDDAYHLTARTLSSFEEELAGMSFMKVHKSYIIQKRYIDYMEGNMMVMKNGREVPIGKVYKGEVKRFLG